MSENSSVNTRKEQAEATKRRLIEAAKKAFSEKGYKGTSVRALSRSIGISESLLYHYFPDGKKELFSEILKRDLSEAAEQIKLLENDKELFAEIEAKVRGNQDKLDLDMKEEYTEEDDDSIFDVKLEDGDNA